MRKPRRQRDAWSLDFERVGRHLRTRADVELGRGASKPELDRLSELWGALPPDFAAYLDEFGWARVGPHVLLGLGAGVAPGQDLVTRAERLWRGEEARPLTLSLLPVYELPGRLLYCLDKVGRGQPVARWSFVHEDLAESHSYAERYPSWSCWFLRFIAGEQE